MTNVLLSSCKKSSPFMFKHQFQLYGCMVVFQLLIFSCCGLLSLLLTKTRSDFSTPIKVASLHSSNLNHKSSFVLLCEKLEWIFAAMWEIMLKLYSFTQYLYQNATEMLNSLLCKNINAALFEPAQSVQQWWLPFLLFGPESLLRIPKGSNLDEKVWDDPSSSSGYNCLMSSFSSRLMTPLVAGLPLFHVKKLKKWI